MWSLLRGSGREMVPVPEMAAFGERFGFGFVAHAIGTGHFWQTLPGHFCVAPRLLTANLTAKPTEAGGSHGRFTTNGSLYPEQNTTQRKMQKLAEEATA
jgi:hypothetical protein